MSRTIAVALAVWGAVACDIMADAYRVTARPLPGAKASSLVLRLDAATLRVNALRVARTEGRGGSPGRTYWFLAPAAGAREDSWVLGWAGGALRQDSALSARLGS